MKRILFLLMLSSVIGFSQQNFEDGPYKEYYSNGQLKREGFYRSLNKVAAWKDYYETGDLKRVYLFDNKGGFTGVEKKYSKDGVLEKETLRVSSGSLVAKHYYENGEVRALYAFFVSNQGELADKNGSYREYYENGSVKIESFYEDNKLSGIWKQFYATGELAWEVEYIEGRKQGVYKEFYKNGKLKTTGSVINGFIEGVENRYDDQGNLTWTGAYEKGLFNGDWVNKDNKGNQLNVLKFKEGKLKKSKADATLELTKIPEDTYVIKSAIYPGCENEIHNLGLQKCLSNQVAKLVNSQFNIKVVDKEVLNNVPRINILFKVDDQGDIIDIKARAPHPALEQEAIRVLKLLPKMKPAILFDKPITVPYSLPLVIDRGLIDKNGAYFLNNNSLNWNEDNGFMNFTEPAKLKGADWTIYDEDMKRRLEEGQVKRVKSNF